MAYGQELVLDIQHCDLSTFTRRSLTDFFASLCKEINMQPEDLHFWDYEDAPEEYAMAPDHLKGRSAVQFIKTSNITVHTLDVPKAILINVFSCKRFNSEQVADFCANWFKGEITGKVTLQRLEDFDDGKPKVCERCGITIYDDQWFEYSHARFPTVFPVCGECLSKLYGRRVKGEDT